MPVSSHGRDGPGLSIRDDIASERHDRLQRDEYDRRMVVAASECSASGNRRHTSHSELPNDIADRKFARLSRGDQHWNLNAEQVVPVCSHVNIATNAGDLVRVDIRDQF
jgi:hypothetical protein